LLALPAFFELRQGKRAEKFLVKVLRLPRPARARATEDYYISLDFYKELIYY